MLNKEVKIEEEKLKKILLELNYITEEDAKKAVKLAKSRNVSLTDQLLTEGLVTKDLLGQAMAEFFKVPYSDLNSQRPPREQVLKIPEETAKEFRAVFFDEKEKEIIIATDDPKKKGLVAEINKVLKSRKKTVISYSLPEDIDDIFIDYRKSLSTRFAKIIEEEVRVAPEIIDEIIDDAVINKVSDIHFEPLEKEVVIRFRIDGVLQEVARVNHENYENILNRIKVQAHLRIDEHMATQDGAFRFEKNGRMVDMRISIAPTVNGEKVVIRLLSQYVQSFTLSDVGLSASDQEIISEASKKPFGMILVTGPTGSGKSTTLYALLKTLHKPDVNITTIEDPVEYRMSGVNQIQVNPQTNLTFAKGLRSIVRQDPDIILVGEIRDQETAEIAVNAALTGHLLLSTFHANDAASTIPRMLDMGLEQFLLASTLEVVVAQRLVRRICDHCRYSEIVKRSDLKNKISNVSKYFKKEKINLYKGKGCSVCAHTGYKGRIAIFEFIKITPEMEDLITKNPSSKQLWELAQKQGSHSLYDDGIEKIKNGVTTLDELLRVAEQK